MFSANSSQVSSAANYIEDVFSTYVYDGNGSTQTINNGINLSGKGGMTWIKCRSNIGYNFVTDTVRGATNTLQTDATYQSYPYANALTAFNNNGFSVGDNGSVNQNFNTFVGWTFRKAPKFFDIVTYTGTGSNTTISHSLGSVPACIMVKRTDTTGDWQVYHSSLANTEYLVLNTTAAKATGATRWNSTTPTSTVFSIGTDATVNASGGTYVAYLFAHDAGGFGLTGADNVISCGGFTHAGANAVQTLGYEPQFLLIKKVNDVGDWKIVDTMRGWSVAGPDLNLYPNTSGAEVDSGMYNPVATGFDWGQNGTFIYIAIRRGPMKVPTSGTSVYNAIAYTGNDASNRQITGLGFPPDLALVKATTQVRNYGWEDRLRGADQWLVSSGTDSESSYSGLGAGGPLLQNGITVGANGLTNEAPNPYILQAMRRAPSFFDEVCYTGTGSTGQVVNHNLAATPEMVIIKRRDGTFNWFVYQTGLSYGNSIYLNQTSAQSNDGGPAFALTSTTITFDRTYVSNLNTSGGTYVAYLFATCAGVSKVGSYTGTGTTKQIDCGFTGGARFVLIKRTDSTGDWYVWDSARGIVSGNDPYLLLNSTAAEVTNTDYVDTYSAGFEISSTAPAAINASGGTFIFLAIA